MDTDLDALETLYARNRKALHWAGFLLGMMALILIIDLQLKKSIARQAMNAARLFSEAVSSYGSGASGTVDPAGGGDGGADRVDGTTGVAENPADQPGQAPGAGRGGVDGAAKRAYRDGRRAGGAP